MYYTVTKMNDEYSFLEPSTKPTSYCLPDDATKGYLIYSIYTDGDSFDLTSGLTDPILVTDSETEALKLKALIYAWVQKNHMDMFSYQGKKYDIPGHISYFGGVESIEIAELPILHT